jgi:hypothetical protein
LNPHTICIAPFFHYKRNIKFTLIQTLGQ